MTYREKRLIRENNPNHLLTYVQHHNTPCCELFMDLILESNNKTCKFGLKTFLQTHREVTNGFTKVC